MRNSNLWDFYRWMDYLRHEAKIWFLKFIIFDNSLFLIDWTKASFILSRKLWWVTRVRIVNWCIITGRAKSVLRDFWLSRMELKNFGSTGFIPGLKKRNF